jgi:hypothetical protein
MGDDGGEIEEGAGDADGHVDNGAQKADEGDGAQNGPLPQQRPDYITQMIL